MVKDVIVFVQERDSTVKNVIVFVQERDCTVKNVTGDGKGRDSFCSRT